MNNTILDTIIKNKKIWINKKKKDEPITVLKNLLQKADNKFYKTITNTKETIFILECKKFSPFSKNISIHFDLKKLLQEYKNYASVVSIITDEEYFKGDFNFLLIAKKKISQPILCKDFFIDKYQIYLARYYQADAILLMLSILNDEEYINLSKIAHQLKMGILTEVSNQDEVNRAMQLKAKVIGINNRDLRNFSIDFNRTYHLSANLINKNIKIISESGIAYYADIKKLNPFVHGFLIGTNIVKKKNINIGIKRIIFGENKVCGLTRIEDAKFAYQCGAIYGGLIFIKESKRKIDDITAKKIINSVPLQWVGVFSNESIKNILNKALQLKLKVIQLHGEETQDFITTLRKILPKKINIWKVLKIKNFLPERNFFHIDRYVFDNVYGGSNKSFNWSLLKNQNLENVLLAGGLNAKNCQKASYFGCSGLDFNSGVEISPGIKDHQKINSVFYILKNL
ncbi:bifunctional indole-3-glycerol-phosphate synthase TrpC/phosphoribosylanthranilate isomerase TrpF [Candidatus Tachikawaea gelatinosa]|uniref:N-(5'-phosphoribosyl)anthranilate isomerase n=1 Tax=Candidatus Tachikawaea gelatinosa TaxID=1410383 RepID=A0A090AM86_9ENTR|nr:bifunctional indole-3-glycerol-phosphate synthase TrpC/phosphoribosylanthranilate isomerase TrpF [Candidatus Tachikawaea gelatinosa]BAP58769.1 indole-3-glycerol phosphate synthase [Candidatus Tachikawaea gelatinosa]